MTGSPGAPTQAAPQETPEEEEAMEILRAYEEAVAAGEDPEEVRASLGAAYGSGPVEAVLPCTSPRAEVADQEAERIKADLKLAAGLYPGAGSPGPSGAGFPPALVSPPVPPTGTLQGAPPAGGGISLFQSRCPAGTAAPLAPGRAIPGGGTSWSALGMGPPGFNGGLGGLVQPQEASPEATRAGASELERLLDKQQAMANAMPQVVQALEGLRKNQEDSRVAAKGTIAALRRAEELDVFMARGADTLRVEVCATLTGKELFHALKRCCASSRHLLMQIRWPTLVTNRLAYGVASLSWGGPTHKTMADWSLGTSDFLTAKGEHFDGYAPPHDSKLEARPRHPVTLASWKKMAENGIKVFASVYGLEHAAERREALSKLEALHESDEHAFPLDYVFSLWEELQAAWCEQLRESRRQLQLRLGTDNPRKEDLRFLMLTPDAAGNATWKFPNVFDLQNPAGYYQQVCMPRQERAMRRLLFDQLHRKTGPAGRAGKEEGAVGEAEAEEAAMQRAGAPRSSGEGGREGESG